MMNTHTDAAGRGHARSVLATLGAALALLGLLAGCSGKPARPLTIEEVQLRDAQRQCTQAANEMYRPGDQYTGNPYWSGYFEMCMRSLGVSSAQLKTLWY